MITVFWGFAGQKVSRLKHFSGYTSKLKRAQLQINAKSQSCVAYSSSCVWNDWLLPAGLPNCSLKQNWMRLHRVDENDMTEQILDVKRRRKSTTESKKKKKRARSTTDWLGCIPSLVPFFSFLLSSAGFIVIGIYKISPSPSSLFSFRLSFQTPFVQKALLFS